MKKLLGLALALSLFFAIASEARKKEMTIWTPDQVTLEQDDKSPMSYATVWGNEKKGAHAGLTKFTKGMSAPQHTHSADHVGVIVSGTLVLTDEAGTEKPLAPGTTFSVPAMVKHATRCSAETDCIVFGYISGKDDMKVVDPTKGKTASN